MIIHSHRWVLPSLFLLLALVTCGRTQPEAAAPSTPAARPPAALLAATRATAAAAATTTPRLVVALPVERFPPGCHPDEVARLVAEFLEAFNRGDQDRLVRLFPAVDSPTGRDHVNPAYLRWYSVTDKGPDGEKRHFVTYTRAPLFAYFRERHRQHERLQLRELVMTPGSMGDVAIGFTLARQADDLPAGLGGPEGLARGKGGIYCPNRTIFLWSMGQGP